MTIRSLMLAALICAAAGLSACGKTGEMTQPAPLFGAKAKAKYDEEQKQADAVRKAQPQPASQDPTAQPLDQAPYAQSIPGAGASNPFGQSPQGSLPNPGTAPGQ
ncbi:MAG: hypothetical protein JO303_01290 [Caulobacteraceae bacterium]|nr:hypothetical protein [Caulobacteraceae bacterium]